MGVGHLSDRCTYIGLANDPRFDYIKGSMQIKGALLHTGISDDPSAGLPACRFCGERLEHTFVDLGMSPLCESYVRAELLDAMEPFYPLHVRACLACGLVQLPAYVPADEIFDDYAYFSSYSTSWVEHARLYVEQIIGRLSLSEGSFVVELASNDGYLLQHFVGTRHPHPRHRARCERRRGGPRARASRR